MIAEVTSPPRETREGSLSDTRPFTAASPIPDDDRASFGPSPFRIWCRQHPRGAVVRSRRRGRRRWDGSEGTRRSRAPGN